MFFDIAFEEQTREIGTTTLYELRDEPDDELDGALYALPHLYARLPGSLHD